MIAKFARLEFELFTKPSKSGAPQLFENTGFRLSPDLNPFDPVKAITDKYGFSREQDMFLALLNI